MVVVSRPAPSARSVSPPPRTAASRRRRASSEGASPSSALDREHISRNHFLKKQQQNSPNLSTVVLRNGVTHLATFPYPLTSSGNPVAPHHLQKCLREQHVPTVFCFCLKPAKYISVGSGKFAGKSAFACHAWRCSFWVVTDDLLASTDGGLDLKAYPRRGSRKLPPTSFLTVLARNPAATRSTDASNSNNWDSVRHWLPHRREGHQEARDPYAVIAFPTFDTSFKTGGLSVLLYLIKAYIIVRAPFPYPTFPSSSPQLEYRLPLSDPSSMSISGGSGVRLAIPKPTYPLVSDHGLRLWSPPSLAQLFDAQTHPSSMSAPAASAVLTSPAGLRVEDFWELWDFCGGFLWGDDESQFYIRPKIWGRASHPHPEDKLCKAGEDVVAESLIREDIYRGFI
ncbi:hypothetical protein C8R46DRAFT_1035803 [Mycena filopes]|nr:hypothetical protein C8R46DRAFT_1035803 [Mycena filopes]